MTSQRHQIHVIPATFAALCVTGLAALAIAPGAVALAQAPAVTSPATAATDSPPPSQLTQHVVDHSGVLSDAEAAELEEMITTMRREEQRDMYVVLQPTFGSLNANQFAEDTFKLNHADNALVLAIATEARKYAVARETNSARWPASAAKKVEEAAYQKLVDSDFAGAAYAAVEAGGGARPLTAEEQRQRTRTGYTLLGTGAGGIAAIGGGLWYANRRRRAKSIEAARQIPPGNVDELTKLSDAVLTQLAQEELVSTDESIRRARSELDLAISEFGAERVRPFTSAMNTSTSTLQRAFQLQQQIDSKSVASVNQRRAMLVEIVSSCGLADDALDAVAAKFADLRNLLVNAPSKVEEITQQLVDLRTRLPQAAVTLEELQRSYEPSVIDSIDENVDLAAELTAQAETAIDSAREQLSLPPGSQGGVVDAIRTAENAISHADKALSSIENAATDIAQAQAGIEVVIAEIEGEVAEAKQLKEQGQAHGARANWDKVTETLSRAPGIIADARKTAEADPLSTYSTLVEYDAELDLLLDTVRESTAQQARALHILDNTLRSADAALRSADDYIGTRGRIVGSAARSQLAEGHRQHALALSNRTSDTRAAIEQAQHSLDLAKRALRAARNDVSAHQSRQSHDSGFTTGLIAGSILNSGSSGGFSGGFSIGGGGGGGGISSSSGSF